MNLEEFLEMELSSLKQDELVDLRALEYVSSYDDHLMCPICHCPFVRPVRLQCDHVFCQKCLNTAITSTGVDPEDFKCPSCRAPARDVFLDVPRLLVNMCGEIQVKCPFSEEGCKEIVPRGHVQTHVNKYCSYRLMDCPDPLCEKKTRKKDLHSDHKCMHELCRCSRCDGEVMEQDLEEHVDELCPSLKTTCPNCQTTVFRKVLMEHIETCPEAIHSCAASKYGCPVKANRADLAAHEQTCPLITMGPYFEAQNSRLDSLELTVRHLQQRNEVFEDGIANIRSILFETSRERNRGGGRPSNQSSENNQPEAASSDPSSADANATTYLLSLHESLREEVAQLSNAITDLDARASMAIMNECLRINEDMAHTNAALNSIRMQVQWLMNPRLHHHQTQRTTDVHGSNTSESAGTRLGSSIPGPSSVSGPPIRPRRLSDGGREGTKL